MRARSYLIVVILCANFGVLVSAQGMPATAAPVGVRSSACGALGQIGDRRASVIDAFQNALKDPEDDLRTCAIHVLTKWQP